MNKFSAYFAALGERDRKAIRLILALSPVLLYLILVQPAYQYYQNAKMSHRDARDLLVWMEQHRGTIPTQSKVAEGTSADSDQIQLLTSLAESVGIGMDRLQPHGDKGIQVWFREVEFPRLMAWLGQLDQQQMTIDTISIDQTGKPGVVSAQCRLRRQ